MKRRMWRSSGWKEGKECQGNYKKMGGNPDGSRKKVKMDLSAMLVAIGNHGSRVNGMNAQTFLVNLLKPLIHLKGHNCKFRKIKGLEILVTGNAVHIDIAWRFRLVYL